MGPPHPMGAPHGMSSQEPAGLPQPMEAPQHSAMLRGSWAVERFNGPRRCCLEYGPNNWPPTGATLVLLWNPATSRSSSDLARLWPHQHCTGTLFVFDSHSAGMLLEVDW